MKKKFSIMMVAAFLLTLLLCATALACPNPNQSCSGKYYRHTYLDENSHELMCQTCGYTFVQAHWGGNATCTKRGTCKGCGRAYISKLGHDWSEWVSNGDDTHTHICKNDESHVETTACSGGTATCTEQAVCAGCGIAYGDVNPSAHNWSEWLSNGDDTHTRTCKNNASHSETTACSGGTATCTDQAVCEGCGEAYGDVDPDAHDWGEWESRGRDKIDGHVRFCERNSGHYEEEDHTGGNPTCNESAVCTVCLNDYFDMTNHGDNETSEWMPMPDGAHHYKLCLGCGHNHTVAPHDYTIPATCTAPAACVCGLTTGDVDPDAHDWGEWESQGRDKSYGHARKCLRNCGHKEKEDHTGGNPTCNEPAECTVCLSQYVDGSNHGDNETSEWMPMSNGTHHYKLCLGCGNNHTVAPHDYTIPATCTAPAACVCGATTGDVDPDAHDWDEWISNGDDTHTHTCKNDESHIETTACSGGTATCTEQAVCEGCGEPYGDALGHAPGAAATCTSDQVCTREGCGTVLTERLGHAPGAAATCTSDQVCTREDCGTVLTERFGHNYESVVVAPVCTEDGYTLHTCSRCGAEHTDTLMAALNHWYGLWSPVGGEKHHADCLREGCDHDKTVACEWLEMTAEDALWRVCPVCGDCEAMRFEAIFGSKVKDVDKGAVPAWGEVIVRGADAPFDGALYAFTAAYEFAGRVQPFKGIVSVTIPLDAEKYAEFRLVRVDVTPATEEAERAEVWTDIPFTHADGKLTFETDVAALFLLIPVE